MKASCNMKPCFKALSEQLIELTMWHILLNVSFLSIIILDRNQKKLAVARGGLLQN